MSKTAQSMTFGQKAAGVSFNPSNDPVVDQIKQKSAELIDLLNEQRESLLPHEREKGRYFSKAISHIEDGQMNAVKAQTWQH